MYGNSPDYPLIGSGEVTVRPMDSVQVIAQAAQEFARDILQGGGDRRDRDEVSVDLAEVYEVPRLSHSPPTF